MFIKWHSYSYSHSTNSESWSSHSTNANFDQLRRITKCNRLTQLGSSQWNLHSHTHHRHHCGTCWSHAQNDHRHGSSLSRGTCTAICHMFGNDMQQSSLSTQVHRLWHRRSNSLSSWNKNRQQITISQCQSYVENTFGLDFSRHTIHRRSMSLFAAIWHSKWSKKYDNKSVSYTHLTLPTIYSV